MDISEFPGNSQDDITNLKKTILTALDAIGDSACSHAATTCCSADDPYGLDVSPKLLRDALKSWLTVVNTTEPGEVDQLLYRVDDCQMQKKLCLDSLSDRHAALLVDLQGLASELQLNVFLAELEMRETSVDYTSIHDYESYVRNFECEDECKDTGDSAGKNSEEQPDDYKDEVVEVDWNVDVLYEIHDEQKKITNLPLDPKNILQNESEIFDEEEPDYEDHEEPPESWRPTEITRYFRCLAFVIIPKHRTALFLSQAFICAHGREQSIAMVDHYTKKCLESPSFECSDLLKGILRAKPVSSHRSPIYTLRPDLGLPEALIVQILRISLQPPDQDLFDLACTHIPAIISGHFFLWIGEALRGTSLSPFPLRQIILPSINKMPTLWDKYLAIKNLKTLNAETPPDLHQIALEAIENLVQACQGVPLYEADGHILVDIACEYFDLRWLSRTIIPLMMRRKWDVALILGFCQRLYERVCQRQFSRPETDNILRVVMASFVESFDVSRVFSLESFLMAQERRETRKKCRPGLAIGPGPPVPQPPISSKNLTSLCQMLLDLEMDDILRALAARLASQALKLKPKEFQALYLPFLSELSSLLADRSEAYLSDVAFQMLFQKIIIAFWNNEVAQVFPHPRIPEDTRVSDARKLLEGFNQTHLAQLLGQDYQRVMGIPASHTGILPTSNEACTPWQEQAIPTQMTTTTCAVSLESAPKRALHALPVTYTDCPSNWSHQPQYPVSQVHERGYQPSPARAAMMERPVNIPQHSQTAIKRKYTEMVDLTRS